MLFQISCFMHNIISTRCSLQRRGSRSGARLIRTQKPPALNKKLNFNSDIYQTHEHIFQKKDSKRSNRATDHILVHGAISIILMSLDVLSVMLTNQTKKKLISISIFGSHFARANLSYLAYLV